MIETKLIKFLQDFPYETIKAAKRLKFKSDSFVLKMINFMAKGGLFMEDAYKTLTVCMELNTSIPLDELYKLL